MEALTLLRYWRSNAGDGATNANVTTSTANTTTIVTGVNSQASETGDEEDDENDHGPFFDLEFSLPVEGDEAGVEECEKNGSDYGEDEEENDDEEDSGGSEMNFTLMSGSSGDSMADVNVSVSPSDELFFNGGFVPVDQTTEISTKPTQFRLALMKSATKFRVMMLKFRKSKLNAESTESTTSNASSCSNSKEEVPASQNGESGESGKSMTVRFNVEGVPIVSLFKRHNSSKPLMKRQNDNNQSASGSSEEKKFSKETMQKYFRKVKPLYVRVSQKYGEKLKLAGNLTFPGVTKPNLAPSTEEQKHSPVANPRREKESTSEVAEPPLFPITAKGLKQGNLPAGLRVVCKHLGKTWSASPAIAAASATAAATGAIQSKRRDDSLIQQEDGIQSAILHCKRSFKASRDSQCSSSLSRTGTDAAGKCVNSSISDAADGVEAEERNK